MPPKKKKPATTSDALGASPAPPATSAVPTLAPAGPKTLRIARVVSPPARTRPGSLPQSIEGFAADAASSLEALRAILTDADADALLARHPDLAWDDAVIQSAEAAVERAMLEAPAVRLPDPDHRPPLALPSAERARAADSPARHKRKAATDPASSPPRAERRRAIRRRRRRRRTRRPSRSRGPPPRGRRRLSLPRRRPSAGRGCRAPSMPPRARRRRRSRSPIPSQPSTI